MIHAGRKSRAVNQVFGYPAEKAAARRVGDSIYGGRKCNSNRRLVASIDEILTKIARLRSGRAGRGPIAAVYDNVPAGGGSRFTRFYNARASIAPAPRPRRGPP